MIPIYPSSLPLTLDLRPQLHPRFQRLTEGISEFTFANLYLFRTAHRYRISSLADNTIILLGRDGQAPFFMLPFGIPDRVHMDRLFDDHRMLKCASRAQKDALEQQGYISREDRNNFDYLFRRKDLALLAGRKYHKKRNLIKAFISQHTYEARPLLDEHLDDALAVLETWVAENGAPGDYAAAREGLEKSDELQLCGGIYYVEGRAVAYVLGEELGGGTSFVIHFEKAVRGYKGLYQFINQSFAAILPGFYATINREQDLGDQGMRHAKLSFHPCGYVEKYLIYPGGALPPEQTEPSTAMDGSDSRT